MNLPGLLVASRTLITNPTTLAGGFALSWTQELLYYPGHVHRSFAHFKTYTSITKTGTSIRGPTVAAKACPLPAPYTATTTAIASSKLLLAAVKL